MGQNRALQNKKQRGLVSLRFRLVAYNQTGLQSDSSKASWYHHELSRHAAEALLLSNGKDGSYLLRKSHDGPMLYALSVRGKDSVKHFQIERTEDSIKFGFNEFRTLSEFVSHFANQPLIGSETGDLPAL
ncbi:hypothetical protein scyTo_0001852 [Scyliorhinus torazame]|uniref:SH2 domain-containing protein n=1 Tax=Scyliorhinus torazame TaxID=75743 RepID=A0A401PGA3_SCYTO|nr:hypothetical protein [Scyliorhinus torazame]